MKQFKQYINEAYTYKPTKADDIDALTKYSSSEKTNIKDLFAYLVKTYNIEAPLVFDPNEKSIKIVRALEKKESISDLSAKFDINFKMNFGNGSPPKIIGFEEFGIKNATQFMEFFQSIGFFIKSPLSDSNFNTLLKLKINGDFKIREFITGWEKFIKFCEADSGLRQEVILLVNGSYYYKQQINISSPYIIWTSINTYYSNLKNKEGINQNIKPNTADIVIINNSDKLLYKVLASSAPINVDEKTGKLECDGVEWYQISLKKSAGGAKLGKITALIKGKYSTGDNLDISGVNTIFEDIIEEGFLGDTVAVLKQVGGQAAKLFKNSLNKLKSFVKNIYSKIGKHAKKIEKDSMKDIDKLLKKHLNESNMLFEKMSTQDKLLSIVNDETLNRKYSEIISKSIKSVKEYNTDVVTVKKENHAFKLDENSINFLVGNVISFKLINNIAADINKNGITVVNDLITGMIMGDTKLPVVKVYGHSSKASYSIITVGNLSVGSNKKVEKFKVMMTNIKGHKEYFVVTMYLFAELTEAGAKYHKISFKKSGAGFNYNIEGSTTYSCDKITDFKNSCN